MDTSYEDDIIPGLEEEEDPKAPPDEDVTDNDKTCPVCLHPDQILVSGPCHHPLCVTCMEIVLNANASIEQRWPPQSKADSHLAAPTLGRCPICRSELKLFQLVHSESMELQYPPDLNYWKKDRDEGNNDKHGAFSNLRSSLTKVISSGHDGVPRTNPLKNAVYIPYRGKPGEFSFHWDWKKLKHRPKHGHDDDGDDDDRIQRPFLNFSIPIQKRPDKWRLDDGSLAPRIKFMEEGCHFHASSRTFHGKIAWPKRLNGSYEWDIVLGFNKDFRFLSSGRIHMKRDRVVPPETIPAEFTSEERTMCHYPMDGRWTVSWINAMGCEKTSEIVVANNEFQQSGWSFYLNFSDPQHPFALWPRSHHRQWVEEGVDLTTEPMGPKPGSKIRWTTSDPRFPELFWVRQTVGPLPTPKVILFGMGHEKFLYQRLHAKTDGSIPKYNGNSVFGNVFTKRLYIGSSSYHFLSPTNCFISYRHPACRDLPPLDDGSPLPTRVDFHNVVWDQEERHLTATIEWEKDFGTSWNDNVRWTLDMYFDTEYMVILKGDIQCEWCRERRARPRPPRPPPRHRPTPVAVYVPPTPEEQQERPEEDPNRNEEWVMSGYGHDQVYINAAALERYRKPSSSCSDGGEVSDENPAGEGNDEDCSSIIASEPLDYKAIGNTHFRRLKREGATKRSIDFLMHLFQAAAEDDTANPIDFLMGN